MATPTPINREYSAVWSAQSGFSQTTSKRIGASTVSSTDALLTELGVPEPHSKRNFWKAVLVVFVIALNVAVLTFSLWTLLTVRRDLNNHTDTLNAIHGQTTQLTRLARENHRLNEQLKTGNATVKQLLTLGGQLVQHVETEEQHICSVIPGCVPVAVIPVVPPAPTITVSPTTTPTTVATTLSPRVAAPPLAPALTQPRAPTITASPTTTTTTGHGSPNGQAHRHHP
jgi:hypothetical protein